jgi:hypothetical protein
MELSRKQHAACAALNEGILEFCQHDLFYVTRVNRASLKARAVVSLV